MRNKIIDAIDEAIRLREDHFDIDVRWALLPPYRDRAGRF
jgi:hypothetical protein